MLIPFDLILYIACLGLAAGADPSASAAGAEDVGSAASALRAVGALATAALAAFAGTALLGAMARRRLLCLSPPSASPPSPDPAPDGAFGPSPAEPDLAARRLALGRSVQTAARAILLAGAVWALHAGEFGALADRLLGAGGGAATAASGRDPWPGRALAAYLLGLTPYLALFVAVWTALHPFLRRWRAHTGETPPGARPEGWGRFLLRQARYNLYFLALWLPLVLLLDVADWAGDGAVSAWAGWGLAFAGLWVFPALVARIWKCRPLPDGPVARLVARLEGRAGTRFSRVYVWHADSARTVNAAAVGFLPPFRYLFLTPALLERLRADELAGVVAHELGHVRHRHHLWMLLLGAAALSALFAPVEAAPGLSPPERYGLAAASLAVFFRFGYGFLSRRFERQADLFALRLLRSPRPLVNALERIALFTRTDRAAPSWHHYGIAERVDFLRAAARAPDHGLRHDRRVRATTWIGAGSIVLGAAALFASAPPDGARGREGRARPSASASGASAARDAALRHWRRVAFLFPDDPKGPLEIARTLNDGWNSAAASPTAAKSEGARRWLAEALSRARRTEEGEGLEALRRELERRAAARADGEGALDA